MALTKVHNRMVSGAAVNVVDFGAVGDGVTDDTAAIQAAIDYAKAQERKLIIDGAYKYKVTDTINIPIGVNHIEVSSQSESISISNPRGAFVWYGGSNKPVILIDRQQSSLYSTFKGLSVINSDPTTYTGVTGFKFRDSEQAGNSFRVKCYNLSVSNCEIGYRLGDIQGGDSASDTNLDEGYYSGLKTYRCGTSLILDYGNGDNNYFEFLFFEGAYSDLVSGFTSDRKIWVRNSGTNLTINQAFVNASDIVADGVLFDLDDGDGAFLNFNSESQDNNIRLIDVNSSADRGQILFSNWRIPNSSSSPYFRDSSNNCVNINSGPTVTFQSCVFDGNVNSSSPVYATSCLFADGYGFVQNDSNADIIEIATRSRTDTPTPPNEFLTNKIVQSELYKRRFSVEKANQNLGNIPDNAFESLFEIALPDNTAVGVKINYFVYGPNVSNNDRLAERGEFFMSAVSDSSGNISSSVSKGSFSQALDGFTSLTVSGQTVNDAANNKVTFQIKQDNNVNSNAIRCTFSVELSHSLTGSLPSMDVDNITILAF